MSVLKPKVRGWAEAGEALIVSLMSAPFLVPGFGKEGFETERKEADLCLGGRFHSAGVGLPHCALCLLSRASSGTTQEAFLIICIPQACWAFPGLHPHPQEVVGL